MPVTFMDPRPPVGVDATVASPRARRASPDGAVFGLLANGFPDSAAFLEEVAASTARSFPSAAFVPVEKERPHDPLTDEQVKMLTTECDAVIAAYGH
jgi:hypothetical protein